MLCIKNGKLVTPAGIREADLYISGDKIFSLGGYWAGAEVYDARGCYVFPGFIDARVQLGLDGERRPTADDYAAGTEAALLGGATTVMDVAVQKKGGSLLEAVDTWARAASDRCSCDYSFHLAVTDWSETTGRELRRMSGLGITSFLAFMACDALRMEDADIRALLCAAADTGFVGVHCEAGDTIRRSVAARLSSGDRRCVYHALTRPGKVEAKAIRRCLALAAEAKTPVWITNLSTAEGLEEIRQARARGQYVLAETCPQYLTLSAEKLRENPQESSLYLCTPPLRGGEDCAALWKAVSAGEIQMISSGHCAYTVQEKQAGAEIDFAHVPAGLPTIEQRAQLLWSEGVAKGRLAPEDLARLLAEHPAKALGLYPKKGVLKSGADADLVIWDPDWSGIITAADCHSKAGYTPWEGLAVGGRARAVFLRGALTASQGIVLRYGCGEYVTRKKVF